MTTNAGGRGLAVLFLATAAALAISRNCFMHVLVLISASGFTIFLIIAIATFVSRLMMHVMVIQILHGT